MTVRISGPRLPERHRVDRRRLRRQARRILAELGREDAELSVSLVRDVAMSELNRSYRGKQGPTDVLSFSLMEGEHSEFRGPLLGEVVIGVETAARQAHRGRRPLDEEMTRLLVHGVLHLLGYDHERSDEARVMRAAERRLLRAVDE